MILLLLLSLFCYCYYHCFVIVLITMRMGGAVRVNVSCPVKQKSENDVEDDGAPGHDHHRRRLDLEVVRRQTTDRQVQKYARHVPYLNRNLKNSFHRLWFFFCSILFEIRICLISLTELWFTGSNLSLESKWIKANNLICKEQNFQIKFHHKHTMLF